MHLFWIPVLPLGLVTRWFCTACRTETDVKRPSQPGILIAGVLFGVFLLLSGIIFVVDGTAADSGWHEIIIGSGIIGGLGWLIARQNPKAYWEAKKNVVPLAADHCPYCQEPIFQSTKPRCHRCQVNIITR